MFVRLQKLWMQEQMLDWVAQDPEPEVFVFVSPFVWCCVDGIFDNSSSHCCQTRICCSLLSVA